MPPRAEAGRLRRRAPRPRPPAEPAFVHPTAVVEPGAVASDFVANVAGVLTPHGEPEVPATAGDDPYESMLQSYLARSRTAFAAAQSPADAAAVIVEAATTTSPKFRWQTSPGASAFVGLSLADLDGSRVLDQTSTWVHG